MYNSHLTLQKGDKLALIGIGTFFVSKRAARDGRNPQPGKAIKISAKNVVKFKVGKRQDEAVKRQAIRNPYIAEENRSRLLRSLFSRL